MRHEHKKHVIETALRHALNDWPVPVAFQNPEAQKLYNTQRTFFAKRFKDVIAEGA